MAIVACFILMVSSDCSFQDSEVEGLMNKFRFCAYIYTDTLIGMKFWNITTVNTSVWIFFFK